MKIVNACSEKKTDCFAFNSQGRCRICTETDFKGNCPFYKTDKQRYEEHEQSVERLEMMGRYDLIGTYGESSSEQESIWKGITMYGSASKLQRNSAKTGHDGSEWHTERAGTGCTSDP